MTPDYQRGVEAALALVRAQQERAHSVRQGYERSRDPEQAEPARRMSTACCWLDSVEDDIHELLRLTPAPAPAAVAEPGAVGEAPYVDEAIEAFAQAAGDLSLVSQHGGDRSTSLAYDKALGALRVAIVRAAGEAAIRAEATPPVGYEPPVLDPDPYERGVLYDAEVEYAMDRLWPGAPLDVRQRIREIVHEVRMADPAPVDLAALRTAVLEMREHRDTITSSRVGRLVRAADALFPRDATPAEPVAACPLCGMPIHDGVLCDLCDLEPQEPAEPVRVADCHGEIVPLSETSDEEGGR